MPASEDLANGSTVHAECSDENLETAPHKVSIAVWDVPSLVLLGESFRVKVGVRCSSQCELAGHVVGVRDETGANRGEGRLGEAPWPGTTGLYAAEMDLFAPATEQMCTWSVTFEASDMGVSHGQTTHELTFWTARPPEHRLQVRVVEEQSEAPLANAYVRLGAYRASTDSDGWAVLDVPAGTYDLSIWKVNYEATRRTVDVTKGTEIRVAASRSRGRQSEEDRVWM